METDTKRQNLQSECQNEILNGEIGKGKPKATERNERNKQEIMRILNRREKYNHLQLLEADLMK